MYEEFQLCTTPLHIDMLRGLQALKTISIILRSVCASFTAVIGRQWWLYPKDSSTRDRSDERDNCRKRNVKEDEEGNIGPHGSALDFGLAVLYKNPISEHVFDYATPSRLDLPSFRRQQATYLSKVLLLCHGAF
jgi:hypothetical protein